VVEESSAAKIILEKTAHLFLIRFLYKLLGMVVKAPMVTLGWPVFGLCASGIIGFYAAKKIGRNGWFVGAMPSVIVSLFSIAFNYFLPAGMRLFSVIFYSLLFVIAGVIGGIIGGKKKKQ